MRIPLAFLVAALVLPAVAVHAQSAAPAGGAPTPLIDDPGGDVQVTANGQGTSSDGRWAAADLKGLAVGETQDDLTFVVAVGSLTGTGTPEVPLFETTVYYTYFLHHDREFRVQMVRQVGLNAATYSGQLQAFDPGRGAYFTLSRSSPVTADPTANTISATFPKDLMVDNEGNSPQPEVPFTQWSVTSQSVGTTTFTRGGQACFGPAGCQNVPNAQASDMMPDQGFGPKDLTLTYGVLQTGHARLSSAIPTRASNGEATTILFQVTASNLAAGEETFMLAAAGAPSGWDVQLPAEHVTIQGNSSVQMPILVSIPFTHMHGAYQFFVLSLTSMKDAGSVGRIQLGVRFSNPPQPAGHHDTLWLHAADSVNGLDQVPAVSTGTDAVFGAGGTLYMNALADDPLDSHLTVQGQPCSFGGQGTPPRTDYCWDVPLSPGLEIGLDFDMNKTGHITIPITTHGPMLASQLSGSLEYFPPHNATQNNRGGLGGGQQGQQQTPTVQLAAVKSHDPVDIQAGTSTPVNLEADLVPIVTDPYIPYKQGASLVLHLKVEYEGANVVFLPNEATPPHIEPGGIITDLPLFEYHDRVSQLFATSSVLMLSADSQQDRMTNPGKEVLFNLTLMNHGTKASTIDLLLRGTHADWATLLVPSAGEVKVAAGASQRVSVVVKVPATATPDANGQGDMADLVLTATDTANLNQRTLARLHVMVDGSQDWPDDAGAILAMEGKVNHKSSPGLDAGIVLLALAGLAVAMRRR